MSMHVPLPPLLPPPCCWSLPPFPAPRAAPSAACGCDRRHPTAPAAKRGSTVPVASSAPRRIAPPEESTRLHSVRRHALRAPHAARSAAAPRAPCRRIPARIPVTTLCVPTATPPLAAHRAHTRSATSCCPPARRACTLRRASSWFLHGERHRSSACRTRGAARAQISVCS